MANGKEKSKLGGCVLRAACCHLSEISLSANEARNEYWAGDPVGHVPVIDSGCHRLLSLPYDCPRRSQVQGPRIFAFGFKPLGFLPLGIHKALISGPDYGCQELRIP